MRTTSSRLVGAIACLAFGGCGSPDEAVRRTADDGQPGLAGAGGGGAGGTPVVDSAAVAAGGSGGSGAAGGPPADAGSPPRSTDASAADAAAAAPAGARNVLIAGPSCFTFGGGIVPPLEALAKETASRLTFKLNYVPAQGLRGHRTSEITRNTFDYVVVSDAPFDIKGDPVRAMQLHKDWAAATVAARPGAIFAPYMTYAFRATQSEMLANVKPFYDEFAKAVPAAMIIPVGLLWLDGVARFGAARWYSDDRHGTLLAQACQAILVHTFLSGTDPTKVAYKGPLSDDEAAWCKESAKKYHDAARGSRM